MQHTKNLSSIHADVARHKQNCALFRVFTTFSIYLILFLVLATGCDTKKESADASGKNNPETVSPSAETQKIATSQQQLQKVEMDSSISQEAQKPQTQEQSSIKVTFVELGSVNCIPCRMMQPIMKEIEEKYKNQVKVVFHDVWTQEGNPYAAKYEIRVIPTQVFLDKDGKEYFRHEGFFPKEQLVEVLKKQGVK
jgi:thioredoxin 1